jgi:hypothetical protein
MAPQPAQGWYPDPRSWAHLRWWDGRQWTDAVQPAMSAAGPSVGQVPARSHPGRVALIVIAAVLGLALLGVGAWGFGRVAGDPVSPRAAGASAPARFAPRSPPASPTASPTVVTPPAVVESTLADATARILATRAAELHGTAYVAIDGSVSMVESPQWALFPPEPGVPDDPYGRTQRSWSLSSHGPGSGDFASVTSYKLAAPIGLDSYTYSMERTLAATMEGYQPVPDEHVTNIYGDPARLVRYRCTIAGVKLEGLIYLVMNGRNAAEFSLVTTAARFDAVMASEMPFISTLTVPADG